MNKEKTIQQGALKYLCILVIQRFIGLFLFIITAGTIKNLRGIIYFALYFLISIVACIIMYKEHQETLNARGKKQNNTKRWDKILMPIYVLLAFYGVYFVAGLSIRLKLTELPVGYLYAGIILYVISGIFGVWPVVINKHFESTSRIQSDRDQIVISNGPYRIVRHPGYSSIVIWAIATTMIFGTFSVGIINIIIISVIIIRTYLEDNMLKAELNGYIEYTKKVKFRLIPLIW